jgi:hypothetical protein
MSTVYSFKAILMECRNDKPYDPSTLKCGLPYYAPGNAVVYEYKQSPAKLIYRLKNYE